MGWNENVPGPGDREHNGGWYGSASELVLRKDGIVFMYVFNHRPYLVDSVPDIFVPNAISGTVGNITAWPTNDLFPVTLSYDAWRAQHFTTAELADPSISGDQANPDGDESVNLLEYATGTNPRGFSNHQPPTGSFVTVDGQRYFALTFRRLILGYELNYLVEASNDLVAWSAVTGPVGTPQLNSDGTQTVTVRESIPADATSRRFLRLHVSRQ